MLADQMVQYEIKAKCCCSLCYYYIVVLSG